MVEVKVATLSTIANVFNAVILLIGLALTGVGAYVFTLTEEIGTAINNELSPIMLVLIVIGSVLVVTALIGFCGVSRKQSLFLSGFLAAMIITLLAQFAAVVILFTSNAACHYYIHDGMKFSMLFYGKAGINQKYTDAMDYIHKKVDCCGQYGWAEFLSTNASNWYSNHLDANSFFAQSLPDTCCKEYKEDCGKNLFKTYHDPSNPPDTIRTDACWEKTNDLLQFWLLLAGFMALVFMIIQVLAVVLNVALQQRYKEHEDYQLQTHKVATVKDAKEKMAVKQNTYSTAV